MIVVPPITVTDSILDASNVAIAATGATVFDVVDQPYALNAMVIYGDSVYQSDIADNNDQPAGADDEGVNATPPTWIRQGYINRWRMFRDGTDSKTSNADSIEVTLEYSQSVNSLAILGMVGTEGNITMTDPVAGVVYNRDFEITDVNVGNWYDFFFAPYQIIENIFFDDLPAYPDASIAVTIDNLGDDAEVGILAAGKGVDLGVTEYNTSAGVVDYSRKERDSFGNLTLVQRRTLSRVEFDCYVETPLASQTHRTLKGLAASPAVYFGDDSQDMTVIYGVYRDFDVILSNFATSEVTIEVEEF